MSPAYHDRLIPEPFRILGLKLKPFSLGHYFWLRRFDCAFVADGASHATREDLIFGVLACSMGFEEFGVFIERKDFLEQVNAWGKQTGIFDLKEKVALFESYLAAATKQPAYWIEDDDDGSAGGHWSQAMLLTLTGDLNYSRSEALNMPLAQAFADFYKHAESLGFVRLMSPEEEAAIEEAEATAGQPAPEPPGEGTRPTERPADGP